MIGGVFRSFQITQLSVHCLRLTSLIFQAHSSAWYHQLFYNKKSIKTHKDILVFSISQLVRDVQLLLPHGPVIREFYQDVLQTLVRQHTGADIRSFSASSLEACAMACVNEPGCKSITTRNSDNYCWLKNKNSGLNGPGTNAALTSMNLECDRSAVDSSCKRDNFDFWGADLKSFISESFEDCASHCRDTADCQSFTLRKSDNYCWLKSKRGGHTGPSPHDTLISMNIDCSPGFEATDKKCAMDGFDFWGADLRNFQSKGYVDCHTSCFDAADCVSFTLRKSDNHCWLKTKAGGQNGPEANSDLISANMSC